MLKDSEKVGAVMVVGSGIVGIQGKDLEGVFPGLDFLRRAKAGEKLGERVAIIEGTSEIQHLVIARESGL